MKIAEHKMKTYGVSFDDFKPDCGIESRIVAMSFCEPRSCLTSLSS